MFSDGMSVVMWIGRVGSRIGSPCWRERAARGIDAERGDVMLGPGRAVAGSAAAGRDVQIAPRDMRPGILHARGQRDRLSLDQRRARDIDVVVREIGPDVGIERDLARRLLGESQSRARHATRDE